MSSVELLKLNVGMLVWPLWFQPQHLGNPSLRKQECLKPRESNAVFKEGLRVCYWLIVFWKDILIYARED